MRSNLSESFLEKIKYVILNRTSKTLTTAWCKWCKRWRKRMRIHLSATHPIAPTADSPADIPYFTVRSQNSERGWNEIMYAPRGYLWACVEAMAPPMSWIVKPPSRRHNSLVYPDERRRPRRRRGSRRPKFLTLSWHDFFTLNAATSPCQFLRLLDFFATRGTKDASISGLRPLIVGFPQRVYASDFDILY